MKTGVDEILTIILKDTYSLLQLKHRLRILKSNLVKTFFGNKASETVSEVELNWFKALPPQFFQQFNKDNIYQTFEELEKRLESYPTLTMYLTFNPDEEALAELGTFTRKLFGLVVLLEIRIDQNLIAGAALSWKGIYKDYSLRVKIEERKDQILTEFKKFLR